MDAITLLKQQHRLVEELFDELESAEDKAEKTEIFFEIADNLAVHASIEERHFYPAVRARQTEEEVEEAYDEHIDVKRLVLDALAATEAPGFDGKIAALKGAVQHHVREEEQQLFPKVENLLDPDTREALGQLMEVEANEMFEAGDPRDTITPEAEPPASQI